MVVRLNWRLWSTTGRRVYQLKKTSLAGSERRMELVEGKDEQNTEPSSYLHISQHWSSLGGTMKQRLTVEYIADTRTKLSSHLSNSDTLHPYESYDC